MARPCDNVCILSGFQKFNRLKSTKCCLLKNYDAGFEAEFKKLHRPIQKKAVKIEKLFRNNPFHPSLRLHKLKWKLEVLWSVSIDRKYRIVFIPQDYGVIVFASIGSHAIYG